MIALKKMPTILPFPAPESPYIPAGLFRDGPKLCPCGHHEGFHDAKGKCLQRSRCRCEGLPAYCKTRLIDP